MRVLFDERRRLAEEDDEEEAECIDAGQQRPGEAGDEEELPIAAARECRGEDRVLGEEAGERRNPDEGERTDQEGDVRLRQRAAEPAHLADVLLAGEVVDDDAGGQEEQRLEEGVRHQVEHRVAVGA
jgi:hypothetical protein